MPNNRMERFTQRARRVLSLAQEAAERLHHNYIGTEHMLIGLMREDGIAARVLRNLGVEQSRVEELVEELTRATARTTSTTLDLSPATKRCWNWPLMKRAAWIIITSARSICSWDWCANQGVAIDVLKRLGVSPEEVRRQTRQVLQESPIESQRLSPPQPTALSTPSSSLLERAQAFSSHATFAKIMQSSITKILEMIEAQKLTIEQATELLAALQPELFLMPSEQTELMTLFKNVPENRRLRITVTDKESGASQLEVDVPLSRVLEGIDAVVRAAIYSQLGGRLWLDESDAHNRLETGIHDEKEPPTSGVGDG